MRKVAGLALLGVGLVTLSGCKRQVPDDIVRKTMTSAVRMHAAGLVSVMCGGTTKGLTNPVVTVTKKNPDGSTGTAHVRGGPLFFSGKTPAPSQCEGDVDFTYTYTSRTTGSSRNRRTTTTWYLQHMKLTAVQTPGVSMRPFDEDPEGDLDD